MGFNGKISLTNPLRRGDLINSRIRFIGGTDSIYFWPKFQGISPQNMAQHMVRLRTSNESDPGIPIDLRRVVCPFLVDDFVSKLNRFLFLYRSISLFKRTFPRNTLIEG